MTSGSVRMVTAARAQARALVGFDEPHPPTQRAGRAAAGSLAARAVTEAARPLTARSFELEALHGSDPSRSEKSSSSPMYSFSSGGGPFGLSLMGSRIGRTASGFWASRVRIL